MGKELSDMTLEELWKLFPIILKEHSTEYKDWYEVEKQNLLDIIDNQHIIRINHIGSTAVKGLISKPTVDILLELAKESNIQQIKEQILHDGWILMSEQTSPDLDLVFNKGYTKEGFAEKVYHLHVRYYNNWNELYFRDYLIEHKVTALEYGQLKLKLKEKYEYNRDGYTKAKSTFIMKVTEKAKNIYGDKYCPR